ncbi:MAG: type II toxin-antitoxin system VapC family toxin [Caldilineaceae bacterium]|nr:type II toxin-antitoxin system VapC family toxin [Caldilineaceae bacterium]
MRRNVVSALRRPDRHPQVAQWTAQHHPRELFLSAVIGEIQRGITQQERHNAPVAHALNVWLSQLLTLYGDRISPLDVAVAQRWRRLSASLGYDNVDLMIAATALHGLTVVARNVRHFDRAGVSVLNPFAPDRDE